MSKGIETIFNSDDQQEIKEAFKSIIINQFKRDLEDNEKYLVKVDVLNDVVCEALEEIMADIKEEVKKELEVKLRNKILEQLKL